MASKKMTARKQALFLRVLSETGNVTQAAEAVELSRDCLYKHRERHKPFREAWERAFDRSIDALEAECMRRAKDGWEEPVYQGGELVGYKRKFSDALAQTLLRGNRKKYRQAGASAGLEATPGGGTRVTINLGADGD